MTASALRAKCLAGGGPLERRVRPHCLARQGLRWLAARKGMPVDWLGTANLPQARQGWPGTSIGCLLASYPRRL